MLQECYGKEPPEGRRRRQGVKELDQKTQWKKVASIQGARLQDAKRAGLPVS